MINCRSTNLSMIFRSNHNLISLLKNPRKALKKDPNKTPQKLRQRHSYDELLCNFPKEFYRKTKINTKMSHQLYLANETIAAKIAQHLISLPDQNLTFVESNPGLGMLTSLLVRSGIKDLRLFEGRLEFLAHLEDTYTKVYPDRVRIKHANLIGLHNTLHYDQLTSGTRADAILAGLPVTEWQNDINFRLFGATGSTAFFKQLIQSIVFQNGLLALGRCELYMVMPSIVYMTLTSSTKTGYAYYRPLSILFQICFEYELLDKFPRTDFLPIIASSASKPVARKTSGSRTQREIKAADVDPELMYFMKIVPRRDLHQLFPPNQIQELWHFIKRNCHSRHNRIIPLLEKLIPGCGARLLLQFCTQTPVLPQPTKTVNLCEIPPTTNQSKTLSHQDYYGNLNIFTKFGDLEPSQLFTLFREFRMLPEYFSCNFLPSLEMVLLKMGSRPDDADTNILKPIDDGASIDDEVAEKGCGEVKLK